MWDIVLLEHKWNLLVKVGKVCGGNRKGEGQNGGNTDK